MKAKLILLISAICISFANVNAQGFIQADGYGTEGDDVVMAHKIDAQGNHYLTGYFSGLEISFGSLVLTNANGTNYLPDLFLVKFNSDWEALWAYSPENDQDAYGDIYNPIDIDVDNEGNCYMTGSFRIPQIVFGDITLENVSEDGEYDPFILKIGTDGTILWAKNFGGTHRDKGRCIAIDPTGNYIYAAGWFYSASITIAGIEYDNTDLTTNTSDIYLARISSSGDFVWVKTNGSNNIDRYQDITVDASGYVYAVGTFNGQSIQFGTQLLSNTNPYFDDGFVVKYNSEGEVLWCGLAGGQLDEIVTSVAADIEGNYYITGSFLSDQLFLEDENILNSQQGGNPTYDAFVAKYNMDNQLVWKSHAGGLGNIGTSHIVVDESNCVYFTGAFSGEVLEIDNMFYNNSGSEETTDCFIVKLNEYGNADWAESAGGNGNDIGRYISILDNEDVMLSGQFDQDILFGGLYLQNSEGLDIFFAKLIHNGNIISGIVYRDVNENGIFDENEPAVKNVSGYIQPGDKYFISDTEGRYTVYTEPGDYLIGINTPDFYNVTPETHSASFTGFREIDDDNDFGLYSVIDTADIDVTITTVAQARKGQDFNVFATVRNIGTDSIYPDFAMPDIEGFSFNQSYPVHDSIVEDSIKWYLPEIAPFEEKTILLNMSVDTVLPQYKSTQSVDIICVCFKVRFCRLVIGQYGWVRVCWPPKIRCYCVIIIKPEDPNDIQVSPADSIPFTPEQVALHEPLEYTIRFQNIGSDTCFKTVVLDTLSENLDISTFEMLDASHDYSVAINGRTLKFTFNDILLPDSTTNEPESHGYIKYRIKTRDDLIIGDSIQNTAYIYFDYEPAVITNTVCTKIGESLGVDENEDMNGFNQVPGKVIIYPNPFDNTATVVLPEGEESESVFELYDITGRLVKEIFINNKKQFRINRDFLKTGMYIYMHKNAENRLVDKGKIIIN